MSARTYLSNRLSRLLLAVVAIGLITIASSSLAVDPTTPNRAPTPLHKLLADSELWGPDAFAFFGTLPRWKAHGDATVLVFADRVWSGQTHESTEAAAAAARSLSTVASAMERKLRPEFKSLYQPSEPRAGEFHVQGRRFLEDDSFRVVIERPQGEFLKAGVSIASIEKRYGRADKVETTVVHARGDRRPAVLTIYGYASGAFSFVLSDLSPTPSAVDRVVIDVNAAIAELY